MPGGGRYGGDLGLEQVACGGVQVLLDGVEAAGDQFQAVRRVGAGDSRLAGDPVRGVLDESADRGQRAVLLVGELREDARELGHCRGRRTDGGPWSGQRRERCTR
ncbi:hypothetical protein Strvi_6421 [Streptomyces violaceusniger Tu 4113]|uniref:Uncharacterized protein n=1 Tax=Streptomyces violaceusniger (strain Tu 4113) TaxID=653045 RepID=G2P859_STRV4|nr:hypothetical protein Strvi_6421 [Streptomyces violaceusniger Tu 4113]